MEKTKKLLLALIIPFFSFSIPTPNLEMVWPIPREEVLAEHVLNLNERLPDSEFGNEVFKYNILLALKYIEADPDLPDSFTAEVELQPGEVFAFQENLLPEFEKKTVKTGWSKYVAQEGYKPLAGLYGNGVCHLASLINWVASDAGLKVTAPANHNFWPVPGVPKEYGTAIRYLADGGWKTENQNLYVENIFDYPIKLVFNCSSDKVELKIIK
jgi:hypothetical protein